MKIQMSHTSCSSKGFTLIEVIIAIMLIAFLGTMLVQYTGTSIKATVESLVGTRNNSGAVRTMESISRDYRNWLESSPNETISDFEDIVETTYPEVDRQIIKIDAVEDPDNSILQLTVTEGDRKLVSLFTR